MKNKTRKIMRLACAILLVIIMQFMGITYAKYLTTEKGTGQAEIAKWGFEIAKDGEQTKNVKLIDTTDQTTLVNGKIAPGAKGTINIAVDGSDSEVDLDFDIKFANEKNKPKNLIFSYAGKTYSSLSEIESIRGKIKYNDLTKIRDFRIFWSWNYETGTTDEEIASNDLIDTQEANTITEYTFDIIATGTQSE